ncbi:hypothetical protein [Tsuneonella rigui]|uniref:hypothetical protein n=1 Tax=Tsuneonella rigui TaxID=1708790 RepID=UPI000F7EAE41|nr:hypothetical protein [Tsuneonella rigui]
MRKSLLLLAPVALAATPALAQTADATGTVSIDGSVAGRCLFTTPSATISLNELALSGSDTNAGKLNTAAVNGKTATLVGWCNSAAAGMTVQAFPLLNAATSATGFTNRVDFTATATANSASGTDTTLVAGSGTPVSVGMFTGNVGVALSASSAPGNALLVAGTYNGSVEVTLSPVFTPPA